MSFAKSSSACAKGAAMMTGTTVDIELVGSCMEMKVNRPLVEVYYEAMTHIPTPEYTDAPFAHASTRLLASSVRLLLVERIK